MTQIRIATLKTYGIETRLKVTMSDPGEIEAAIRDEAARWAEGFDANSLIILAKALRGFDVTAQFGQIKAKVLFVLSRTDKLFPPDIAPGVMQGLKAAGVDADYFLLDSELGHSASGLDAHKWAPRLKQFMDSCSRMPRSAIRELPRYSTFPITLRSPGDGDQIPAIITYLISTYSSMP